MAATFCAKSTLVKREMLIHYADTINMQQERNCCEVRLCQLLILLTPQHISVQFGSSSVVMESIDVNSAGRQMWQYARRWHAHQGACATT